MRRQRRNCRRCGSMLGEDDGMRICVDCRDIFIAEEGSVPQGFRGGFDERPGDITRELSADELAPWQERPEIDD